MLASPSTETRLSYFTPGTTDDLATADAKRVRTAILESVGRDVSKPIAVIVGAAAGLKALGNAAEGEVQDELINSIQTETARLERFVSILLDMAKLECHAVELRAEPVFLKDVVRKAVKDATNALHDRNTDVSVPTDLPPLRLDQGILRRVLLMLIEAAAKRSPPDTTVSIHAGRDRTAIRLQVLDESDGIPPTNLAGQFEQFHLPCSDEQGRSAAGMSLAVCRGYIEAMGGSISGSNRTDRSGAVFTITFPISA